MSADDRGLIVDTINRYAFVVDTQHWDLFDQVFTQDVEIDVRPNGHYRDLETFTKAWAEFHEPLRASQHTFTNHQVKVDGDRAHAHSYVVVRLMRTDGGVFEAGGWYDDRLVRTPAGWRIAHRVYGGAWWQGEMGAAGYGPDTTGLKDAAATGKIPYLKTLAGK
jgi:3-phenylpropionate/cinnamic acid dioxygenase small subunit